MTEFSPQSGDELKQAVDECVKNRHQKFMEDLGQEAFRRRYMPNMGDIPSDMMSAGRHVSTESTATTSSVTKKKHISRSPSPREVNILLVEMDDCATGPIGHKIYQDAEHTEYICLFDLVLKLRAY